MTPPAALGLVAELASQGADLRRFVADAVEFFRGVFLAQYAPNLEEVVDEPGDVIAEWRRHAAELPPADVLRAVDQLGETLLQLRQGREERLVIELALLRLTRPETVPDADSLDVPGSIGSRSAIARCRSAACRPRRDPDSHRADRPASVAPAGAASTAEAPPAVCRLRPSAYDR